MFRVGQLQAIKEPGWFWSIPLVERVVKVDLRIVTFALDTPPTVTRDGVAVRVNAVLWFRAFDPAGVVTIVAMFPTELLEAAKRIAGPAV